MRPLLLLLLTFLIPLQLLAATGPSQPREGDPSSQAPSSACVTIAAGPALGDHLHAQQAEVADSRLPAGGEAWTTVADDGEEDLSSCQGDLEDPTLPTGIATPQAFWQPFPHAFLAPLSGSSYLRDQLRPPPLA